jgi:FAD/FMN-containing dehydrogenase
MITGGRSSTVGVGGLTLGGGISYYSAEHGLVCDNILEFEVVLADGRVVNASGSSNADLFAVLKGGGNNFGIVTNFRFPAFKYEGMWGGLVAYPEETIQDHFRALVNFINKIDKNPKASAIVTAVYQSRIGAVLAMNFYDFAAPVARASAYDEFLAIPGNLSDSTGFRNLSSLAQEWAGATTHRYAKC